MEDTFKDYFMILEVHYMASQGIVKSAYKQLSKNHHPDLGGDKEKFQDIQEAYETLSNGISRKIYEDQWLNYHRKFMDKFETGMVRSLYDVAFLPARQIVLEYMFFILHKDYESAYLMLSNYNKKRINKREYHRWQTLIGEIHQLIEFDCVVESISQTDSINLDRGHLEKSLIFKVKVKERNLILNRIEEEFFQRKLVYEEGMWRIRLKDIDIKRIIKKYGKIIALSKRNSNKLKKMRPLIEEHYPTQQLSFSIFIKHCEYEFTRFIRYKNPFVIIKIQIKSDGKIEHMNQQVIDLLENNTRRMDAFSQYENQSYLLFLPETDLQKGLIVSKKISDVLNDFFKDIDKKTIENQVIVCKDEYVCIKEMLQSIDVYW